RAREDFRVLAREQRVETVLGKLPLRLQVDRVDQLADGSLLIIDYKSGRSEPRSWLGERPSLPQLPLYGVVSEGAVQALAFAQVRPRACAYRGLGRSEVVAGVSADIGKATRGKADIDNWPDLLAAWRVTLEGLADDFVAGRAEVDPLNGNSCTWCGLQALCRIDAMAEAGDAEVTESEGNVQEQGGGAPHEHRYC
ncbi:MAG: PD-(D/E)XK nuclease family protein, partial [Parahaliea sp.]